MSIQEQQAIAMRLYDKLKLIDPNCVLAGGAPRDWYLGAECNDLDFYFCSTGSTLGVVKKQLKTVLGVEVDPLAKPQQSELYKYMPGLQRIWNAEIEGMDVQLIEMADRQHRYKVVDNMDVSICKAWYSHSGEIRLHRDFKLTLGSKIMFLRDGYAWSNKHGTKMRERFKGKYEAGTLEQAERVILRKALEQYDD